jgi:hypothetical protein
MQQKKRGITKLIIELHLSFMPIWFLSLKSTYFHWM